VTATECAQSGFVVSCIPMPALAAKMWAALPTTRLDALRD